MAKKIFTYHLSELLHGTVDAKVDIHTVDGNLVLDALTGGSELANGELQYLENQEPPTSSVDTNGEQVTLRVKSGSKGQPWFHFPWSACNGATEWQIHLNPKISLEISAHSGGGNIRLDLRGLKVTRLTADTGGGNMEVYLPDLAAGLNVTIKSGAGNVTIHLPAGVAARIHAATGLGRVVMEGSYTQIGKSTYQSSDFENAIDRVEIDASSGAGNVIIQEKSGSYATAAVRE